MSLNKSNFVGATVWPQPQVRTMASSSNKYGRYAGVVKMQAGGDD